LKTSIVSYLVKRFLRFDSEQPFIFLSALLAFLGISLGVMVLIVAMALMNGFDNEFRKKLTIMNYPLTIIPKFYGAVNENLLLDLKARATASCWEARHTANWAAAGAGCGK